ncbi:MAG: response regulator [Magnetovibrio sp.]|nr:response regulator [Magnetovibrio sp.]
MSGLGNIHVMLGEPNVQIRRTIADTLRNHGYHAIRDTAQPEKITDAIFENQIDVLICDVELGGQDMCELIYRIRHHHIGNNPFLVTMVLTDNPSVEMVRKIVNSGADDVLLKPVSVQQILDRLDVLSNSRKGFVVTTEYIGPDRRINGPRPGTQEIEIIDVPNPLQYKRDENYNVSAIQNAINIAARMINDQKMERHAFQIDYLVDQIVPRYTIGDVGGDLKGMVRRLVYVAEDLVRRMAGTEREHIRSLGESLIKISKSIHRHSDDPDKRDIHLLPELGAAIKKAFDADEKSAALARDISDSIGREAH